MEDLLDRAFWFEHRGFHGCLFVSCGGGDGDGGEGEGGR